MPTVLRRSPRWVQTIRQRLRPLPVEPEESVPLRILVQLLVTVGLIATDVAAADSAGSLGISVWAVPLSAIGAAWSWFRRRQRNIPIKFCIAVGMLVALAAFFLRLWSERNDTRLALAVLLIHLQVLHSFDLPRRKDLGYSAVIGLILIGVAATLSQTLAFTPLLLLFVAIALPVLLLDYRSRLGLVTPNFRLLKAEIAPQRWLSLLLVVLGLGLGIFLLLPRLPGYQLRTFPVSAPIKVGEFNRTAIVNPGYVRTGKLDPNSGPTHASGDGMAETGPGEVDQAFYYGFNSRINQNLRGQMQPRLVMRVRSQAPGFWRVLAFDRYTGQGWEISRNADEQVQTLLRPEWSYRFSLPWSVTLNKTREVVQSYTIVSELPNLIPALYEPKELYFPTEQVAVDAEDGLRSPVPLSEGLTYTVVSEVAYRDRTKLTQAPAASPPPIEAVYLQGPPEILPRVRQATEAMLAKSPKPLTAASEKALYLAQYLKQNYTVQPDLPFFEPDEDLAEAFLFKYQGGYPDHFATVLTIMLRSIGIPARLVMGFAPGPFNPLTGYYEVRNTDAHAMTEVYFHRYGWFYFDPLPGHEVIPQSIEESQVFGLLQQLWSWIAGWLPSPVSGILNRLFELISNAIGVLLGGLLRLLTEGWIGVLTALAGLLGLGFLGWLGWSGWRAWWDQQWLKQLPPMEALYQQMLRELAEEGHRKLPHQTPLEYAEQCRHHQPAERAVAIGAIIRAYLRWRYGGYASDVKGLQPQLQMIRQTAPKRRWSRRVRQRQMGRSRV